MTPEEKAYLAGLFDSRCYIGIRYRRGRPESELELCRSLAVLERVKEIVGFGNIRCYKSGHRYRLRGRRVNMVMEQVGGLMYGENRYGLQEVPV